MAQSATVAFRAMAPHAMVTAPRIRFKIDQYRWSATFSCEMGVSDVIEKQALAGGFRIMFSDRGAIPESTLHIEGMDIVRLENPLTVNLPRTVAV